MNITNEILKHKTSSNHHIQIHQNLKTTLVGYLYIKLPGLVQLLVRTLK